MFMNGPHGREYIDAAMKERLRLAANEGRGHYPPSGARRDTPPIRTVEKEWGGLVSWDE